MWFWCGHGLMVWTRLFLIMSFHCHGFSTMIRILNILLMCGIAEMPHFCSIFSKQNPCPLSSLEDFQNMWWCMITCFCFCTLTQLFMLCVKSNVWNQKTIFLSVTMVTMLSVQYLEWAWLWGRGRCTAQCTELHLLTSSCLMWRRLLIPSFLVFLRSPCRLSWIGNT